MSTQIKVIERDSASRLPSRLLIIKNGTTKTFVVNNCQNVGSAVIIRAENRRFIGRWNNGSWEIEEWPQQPTQFKLF